MKLSEKQAMILLDIAKDSLRLMGRFGGYPENVRAQVVSDIINQQSNDLIELDQDKKPNKKDK